MSMLSIQELIDIEIEDIIQELTPIIKKYKLSNLSITDYKGNKAIAKLNKHGFIVLKVTKTSENRE